MTDDATEPPDGSSLSSDPARGSDPSADTASGDADSPDTNAGDRDSNDTETSDVEPGDADTTDTDSDDTDATDSTGGMTLSELYDVIEETGRPVVDAATIARVTGDGQRATAAALESLVESGDLGRVETDGVAYYPESWGAFADRERLVVFPDRREIVADQPTQFTRARLASFAHLVDSTGTEPGTRGYLYEIRPEDVWAAPVPDLDALLSRVRSVLPRRAPALEEWIEDQWTRANQFRLRTHEDGYTVLEAARESLMGNVARQKLADGDLRAPISDTESWVNEDRVGAVKRTLYEAGYPVVDDRDLDTGESLDATLTTSLRSYQRDWVDRFRDQQAGVLVAPPGSGKTIAAIAVLTETGGETLVLCPSRKLVGQWRKELLAHTDLDPAQIGEYHGGTKQIRPVTIATYQTAGMDRHRSLFDSREWGLLVFDEAQRVPASVNRRTADLQSKQRLGLSVDGDTILPVRSEGTIETRRIESLATEYLGQEPGVSSISNYETLAVTENGSVEWTTLQAVMRHEHDDPMYRVRASNGREVTVTADHSLVVFDGKRLEICDKLPENLSDDDYLLQPSSLPDPGPRKDTVDLLEHVNDGFVLVEDTAPESVFDPLYERGIADNKSRYNWKTRRNLPLSVAREIDLDKKHIKGMYVHGRDSYVPPEVPVTVFARLLGLFVADGALDEHRVEFYAKDTDTGSEVARFLDVIHGVCPETSVSRVANGPNCTTLRVSGILVEILRNLELQGTARTKAIPSIVLSNPQAYVPFIEGLTLGDGYRAQRDRNRETVSISTSSDRVEHGLNLMLASLGHVGGVYYRNEDLGVREAEHDTVSNALVRFNPRNRNDGGRLSLTPFTERLRTAHGEVERYGSQKEHRSTFESGLNHRTRLNDTELSAIIERSSISTEWLKESDVAMLEIDSVDRQPSSNYVYDVSTEHQNFLGNHLFCHNSASPVREDDKEEEIYTLIGPPLGTDWGALFDAGYVLEPEVEIRYVGWDQAAHDEWAAADGRERRQIAATNPAKIDAVRRLRESHPDARTLIFVDYIAQGEALSAALDVPFVSGETRHHVRERRFEAFRQGDTRELIVSRVADEGLDLPNAEAAIVASGLGGSRRQGTQRAGRTMRPGGSAQVYVLATRGTSEEEFARRRMSHLAEKGIRVRERTID